MSKKYSQGIVIGSFQCLELSKSYKQLIKIAFSKCEKVTFIITSNKTRGVNTKNNPFDFETRKDLILESISFWDKNKIESINELVEQREDKDTLNDLLKLCTQNHLFNPKFYTLDIEYKNYLINYNNVQFFIKRDVTDKNTKVNFTVKNQSDFRKGILYKSTNTITNPFPTTDIAVLKEGKYVLLGRKPNEQNYRFPGGFVDITDKSYEAAALRELHEECGYIEVAPLKYVTSVQVNDWRYKNEENKIISTLFVTDLIFGVPKAGDDLAEVKWILIDDINIKGGIEMVDEHIYFFQALKNYIKKSII